MKFDNIKKEFPFFKANPKEIYFDSAATTLKPQMVLDGIMNYYINYGTNVHSTDSDLAYSTYKKFSEIRSQVLKFVNGYEPEEIVFTSGATFAINIVAYGLAPQINKGDEILLTEQEHGANILPWYRLAKEKGAVIKFIPHKNYCIDLEELEKMLSPKTKVITFANITNVLGYENDVPAIAKIVKKYNPNILIALDCAQSLVLTPIDAKKWNVDFVSFSAHKLFGPTGIGVLWGKKNELEKLVPFTVGGGMNLSINKKNCEYRLKPLPSRLEAGSPNVAGVFGLSSALEFVDKLGFENLVKHEQELKRYAVNQFQKHLADKVVIYNADSSSGAIIFNVKDHFAQDVATHLGSKNHITIRSGDHCAKLINHVLSQPLTLRASFSVYNDTDEIDTLVAAIKNENVFLGKIV